MKIFRFMSIKEFTKYKNGEQLINNTNHHEKHNQKTNSIGFCFFNLNEYKPERALHFLTGIVDFDICAIFEVDEKHVKKTWGRYHKPLQYNPVNVFANYFELLKNNVYDNFIANEYCITEYSKNDFKLIAYTIPDWFNDTEWKWIKKDDTMIKNSKGEVTYDNL